ncbi:Mov34/MPN/PAD-1 family protein [Novosphingobium sp. SG916]|uniref:Mov34/MPN/PAD-1 family protein n=1 Tax=unclassified Novosphingobium TaxID=2644732 RepID=UPI0018145605|nr:putative GIY-YIG superfamily endonuclease/proteasome lid subunit RPN8/RPN11 [Novosphingobium sp. SG919]NMN85685.1 putative GIY-YIG superfamily endonuclease/proteasome lid subunit RPN8/RPN11 [Novosphingobium sp. SG916]
MAFHAYLLRCADGSFYAGHTDDLTRRMAQHESGQLGGFTAKRRPVRLVWQQDFATREEALSAELRIKGWSRAKKQALIDGDWDRLTVLARNRQAGAGARGGFDKLSPNGEGGSDGKPSASSASQPPFALSLSKGASATPDITLSPAAHATMLAAAAQAHPREACGLLLGTGLHIGLAQECTNVAPDPLHHFEIDPLALIAAHRTARAGGPAILGYFHSHPNGLERPSATDSASRAGDGRIWAIVTGAQVTLWRDAPSAFQALSYRVADG